jgi:peptidoglycan hydrolase-like protein with peptidoglycan-binding domain
LGGGNRQRAVEVFQRASGLTVTGRVDAALLEALCSTGSGDVFTQGL